MSRQLRTVAIVATAMFFPCSLASAASQWTAPVIVGAPAASPSAPGKSNAPAIGSDKAGNLTAVWFGDHSGTPGIYAARRPVGSAWTAPTQLVSSALAVMPTVAVSANGDAVAGWIVNSNADGDTRYIQVTRRARGGSWSTPERLEPATPADALGRTDSFALGMDASGGALGLWSRTLVTTAGLLAGTETTTSTRAGQAAWRTGEAPAEPLSDLNLALDAAGNATAVYQGGDQNRILSSYRPAGGSWTTPAPIDDWVFSLAENGPSVSEPDLAVNAAGDAVAIWQYEPDDNHQRLQSATRSPGGPWSAPKDVSATSGTAAMTGATVGIDAKAHMTVAWRQFAYPGFTFTAEIRRSTAASLASAWSGATVERQLKFNLLDPKFDPDAVEVFRNPRVAVGAGGSTAITWARGTGGNSALEADVEHDTGAWQGWSQIAGIADEPNEDETEAPGSAVVVDPRGQATVVWADGHTFKAASIALAAPTPVGPGDPDPGNAGPVGPGPVDPGPGPGPDTGGGGNAPLTDAMTAPVTPPAGPTLPPVTHTPEPTTPAVANRLVIAVYLVPSGKKCPTRVVATVAGTRTALTTKAVKQRKKVLCKTTGVVVLKAVPSAGATVPVVLTAKGVKRKAIAVKATA